MLRYGWIGLLLLASSLYAQDQEQADSLRAVLAQSVAGDSLRMELLKQLAFHETDPVQAEAYSDELIALAAQDSVYTMLLSGFLQKGNANLLQGNLEAALQSFMQSLTFATRIGDVGKIGALYSSIADAYSLHDHNENAILYYNRAIANLRQSADTVSLASALYNTGDQYLLMEQYDTALQYFAEAGEYFQQIGHQNGIAYNLGNTGAAYAGLGENQLAEQNIDEAIRLLETLEDYYPISVFLIYMSDIYLDQEERTNALAYAKRALELARQYGLKDQISEANLRLSALYEQSGRFGPALDHYQEYVLYRDSVTNLETVQNMADLHTAREVALKQSEVDLLNQQRRTQRIIGIATAVALFLIGLLAFGLYRRNRFIRKTNQIIAYERERSEKLLRNILPAETAQELKEHGKVQAKSFPSVTVLFTDFVGFTRYAEQLSPEALVESVDFYFSKFDEIVEEHGLEKIKTIGDAYMCAGGLPYPSEDHARRAVAAALAISRFVQEAKVENAPAAGRFDIRIGISTGPVVAGVIGAKKFAYDIWGDTVNVASRMESNSVAGRVNISETTYQSVKAHFACAYRGALAVKNRGEMKMYFVQGVKHGQLQQKV